MGDADREAIRRAVLEEIEQAFTRVIPGDLEKSLARRFSMNRKDVRSAVHELVAEGFLTYMGMFGRTVLEKSFHGPVRISRHVVLTTPGTAFLPGPGDVVVEMLHGAAFGTGEHPTTRLAVRGIEHLFTETEIFKTMAETLALDVGTGSGVLALSALRFGIDRVLGLDYDPCARHEAIRNAEINGLAHRLEVRDGSIEELSRRYHLILANLRLPTLIQMADSLDRRLVEGGAMVFSGIRAEEAADLLECYGQKRFRCLWQEMEKDWAALAVSRIPAPQQLTAEHAANAKIKGMMGFQ